MLSDQELKEEVDKEWKALGVTKPSASLEGQLSCLIYSLIVLVLSLSLAVWVNWIL